MAVILKNTIDKTLQATIPRSIVTAVTITSTGGSFTSPKNNVNLTPASITLTASVSGMTSPTYVWEYALSSAPSTWVNTGITTAALTVTSATYLGYIGTSTHVTYRCTASQTGWTTASSQSIITYVKETNDVPVPKLSKYSILIPAASDGTVTSYANTGYTIQVSIGGTNINYDATNALANTFTVTAAVTTGTITVAAPLIVASVTLSYGDLSAMTTDSAVITYTVRARDADGILTVFTIAQTVTKVKSGSNGTSGTRGSVNVNGIQSGLTQYPGRIEGRAKWSASPTLTEANALTADATAQAVVCAAAGVPNLTANLVMGDTAILSTSPGGTTWVQSSSGVPAATMYSVSFGTKYYVAVGSAGNIVRSLDASNWASVANGFGASNIKAIAYGTGGFIACSDSGIRQRSTDSGATWTTLAPTFGGGIAANAVVCAEDTWIMAGGSGKIEISRDSGATWITPTTAPPTTVTFYALAYGNGIIIAVGQTSTSNAAIYRSVDKGVTWTSSANTFGATILSAATYGSGKFVAGGQGGKIASSIDGSTWTTPVPLVTTTNVNGIFEGRGIYMAVQSGGTLYSSNDAVTWTAKTSSHGASNIFGGVWYSIAYVTVAQSKIAYSTSSAALSISGYWGGASWLEPGTRIPGNLLVDGTLSAGTGIFNKAIIKPSGYWHNGFSMDPPSGTTIPPVVVTNGTALITVPITNWGTPLFSCAVDTTSGADCAGKDLMYSLQWWNNTTNSASFRLRVFDVLTGTPFTGNLDTVKIWVF